MIVAFSGKRGSGKDTAGDVLVNEFHFQKIALADPMKRFVQDLFGMTYDQLWGPSASRNAVDLRWNRSPRELLQTLGTEWGRVMGHPDVWIQYLVRRAQFLLGSGAARGIVVTDIRYENELHTLSSAGATVVRIVRPGIESTELDRHSSEVALDGLPTNAFACVLHNVGTKSSFEDQVREFARMLPLP